MKKYCCLADQENEIYLIWGARFSFLVSHMLFCFKKRLTKIEALESRSRLLFKFEQCPKGWAEI